MDRDVIARKLEQLRHHAARIESKKPFRAEDLAANEDLRDVVVFNLVQAVGFRNVAVHGYATLDLAAVLRACEAGLEDLRRFAAAIAIKYVKPEGEAPPGSNSNPR